MSINDILSTAKTALTANQTALNVTSNNISNVNTPGYSRQRIVLGTGTSVQKDGNILGTGVVVEGVERVYDRFVNALIIEAKETLSMHTASQESLNRLESIFSDTQGNGLDAILQNFFNGIEDVSNDPESYAARSVLLANANVLTDKIRSLDTRAKAELFNVDTQITASVDNINTLASRIGELNGKITQVEIQGQHANELRDERARLVEELAGETDITVIENDSGSIDILLARGNSLIAGTSVTEVTMTSADINDKGSRDILLGGQNISSSISSGRLKGLLDVRSGLSIETIEKLELLAATLTKEFNTLHRRGYGLDSSTGLDFFNALTPFESIDATNTGDAVVSSSIYDLNLVTLDDYEIRFSSPTTFNIYNTTKNTTVSSGVTYTSGANIDFDGIRMVISDTTNGPKSGDSFKVSTTKNASMLMSVSLTDAEKFAAAKNATMLPGDNTNVLDMTDLEDAKILNSSTVSFSDYFRSMVSDIGSATYHATINKDGQEVVVNNLESYRDSITSVSMDEEGVNLIKFQHAYEAAARVITTVDSLYDTILSLR